MKNILESFLDALEVRYTKRYVRRLYEEHPHRGNMYGLKQMLAVYGVRALGVYMEDKDLLNLSYPCIFHTGNDFVIGLESNGSRIVFWQQGKKKHPRMKLSSRIGQAMCWWWRIWKRPVSRISKSIGGKICSSWLDVFVCQPYWCLLQGWDA